MDYIETPINPIRVGRTFTKMSKTNKIQTTIKNMQLKHHLAVAGKTALLAGLYAAGMLTVLYGQEAYRVHVEAIQAEVTPQTVIVTTTPKAPAQ